MKEFTDEQIINSVKCCAKQISNCSQCSYRFNEDDEFDCEEALGRNTLDLINRQAAEIENLKQIIDENDKEILKLQKRIIFWREDLNYQPEKIKSEAIKGFAERLKIKVKMYNSEDVDEGDLIDDLLTEGETVEIIDNLVKEMTEEEK